MASATPDLRLPSQLQSITAQIYRLVSDKGMCVNNLPKVVT